MNPLIQDMNNELQRLIAERDEKKELSITYQRAMCKLDIAIKAQQRKIKETEQRLLNLKTESAIHITDHAIVRYLERVLGLDVEGFRQQILKGELGAAVKCFESGRFPVKGVDGPVKAIVESGTIVTFR